MKNLKKLECSTCPAKLFINVQLKHIESSEYYREFHLQRIKEIKLILLCESIPAERFFYNPKSVYEGSGLRYLMREELTPNGTEEDLFEFMINNGIILFDCALCPLHKFGSDYSLRIIAAKYCLEHNNIAKLNEFSTVPIIKIFPKNSDFDEASFPDVKTRIIKRYEFRKIYGLKQFLKDNKFISNNT